MKRNAKPLNFNILWCTFNINSRVDRFYTKRSQKLGKYSSLEQKPKNHPLSQKHQHIYVSYICKYVYVACMHTFVAKITTCALWGRTFWKCRNSWLKNEIYSWIVSLQCQLLVYWSLSRRFLLIDLKLSTSMSSADRLTDNTPLPGQLSAHCSRIKVNAARPKPFRVDNWTCRLIQISSYPIVSSPFPFWFSLLFKQKVLQISVFCW